jgi:hypothetical protein
MEEEARYVDHIVHDRYRHRGVLRSAAMTLESHEGNARF